MHPRRGFGLLSLVVVMACSSGGEDAGKNQNTSAGQASGGSATAGAAGGSAAGGAGDAPSTPMAGSSNASGGSGNSSGAGPSGGTQSTAGSPASGGASGFALPPANAGFDYQIGGGYTPPYGVTVVSRDRSDTPAAGLYNICYVNGFQAQPADDDWWLSQHPELVLRNDQGEPIIDPDWDEMLLDTSTDAKRQALAEIVGDWIRGCAADGFDAIEIDNLDSYSRSKGKLTQGNNVAFMKLLSAAGHQAGLAMGQKNSSELLARVDAMATDFAVVEECNRYSECGDFKAAYGNLVFIIEYRDEDFATGCQEFPELSIVRRDVDVSTPGAPAYRYDGC